MSDLVAVDGIPVERLSEICRAEQEERLVILPCKPGDTVWVLTTCANVHLRRDDDYIDGTGAVECPFEASCEFEHCNNSNLRIFETFLADFWYGKVTENHPEFFCEDIGRGFMLTDFGKTVFLTYEAAEEVLQKVRTTRQSGNSDKVASKNEREQYYES